MTSEAAALTEQEREQIVEAIYQGRVRGCREKVENWGPTEDEAETHSLLLRVLRGESEVFVANALPVIESILSARLADSRPVVSEAAIEAAAEAYWTHDGYDYEPGAEGVATAYRNAARAALTAAAPHMGNGLADAPRVAKSLDDLRIGQVVVQRVNGEWLQPFTLTEDDIDGQIWWTTTFDKSPVVILSEPRLSPTGDDTP